MTPIIPVRVGAALANSIGLDTVDRWPAEMLRHGIQPSEYRT